MSYKEYLDLNKKYQELKEEYALLCDRYLFDEIDENVLTQHESLMNYTKRMIMHYEFMN